MAQIVHPANVCLIAAAPDLLAVLESVLEIRPCNWDDDETDPDQAAAWRAAFRAVRKARGEPLEMGMEKTNAQNT